MKQVSFVLKNRFEYLVSNRTIFMNIFNREVVKLCSILLDSCDISSSISGKREMLIA